MTLHLDKANGEQLPASREAAVAQGLAFYQETAAERDRLYEEVGSLKTTIAACRVTIEVMEVQQAELQSQVNTAGLMRDQAVADRAKWETLFLSIVATLNAFAPPTSPLIKTSDTKEITAATGAGSGGG